MNERIVVPEGVMVRDLAGELVLLELESERYFGLDETGARMWAALTETGSVAAACDRLLREYEVEPAELRADVDELLSTLVQAGLVKVEDA